MMRKDKDIAISLRKQGEGYRSISRELKIPMSTLSSWFSGEEWSKEIRKSLSESSTKESRARIRELNRIRGQNLKKIYEEARVEAAEEFEKWKHHPLFVAGVMLYWGEGDKLTKHHVKLTNTDPKMLGVFVSFLTQACGVPLERVRGQILLYPDLEDWLCRVYWAQETGLPKGNFTKSTVIQGKHKTRKLSFGVCMVTVSSTYLKVKMLEWIKLFSKELMEKR